MAEKAKHWITVKGAHIPLDEERQPMNRAGKKIAASAEHDGAVSPKADTKLYDRLLEEHEGDHVEAARAYYRSKLQGKFVKAVTPQGEVRVEFTGSGWQHLKANMKNDSVKAALTPHIPSIVLEGEYFNTPLHKEHGSIIAFHSYRKKLDTVEGPRTAIVDVAQQSAGSRPEHFVYGLTREGGYGYEKRREEMLKKEKPQPGDAGLNLRPAGAGDGLPAGAGPNPRREESVHSSNIEPLFEVVNLYFEDEVMPYDNLTFDAKSVRTVDENGFLHVAVSHISKETVNPYRGNEIPGWQERGLDPQRIYFGYRKGEELEKAAPTFNGLPLLRDHHHESAEHPQKEFRIGTLGTEAAYRAPYLDNALVVTDASAIAEIENGDRVELSCSYRYVPVFEPGTFEGKPYDFVMTDIRGNHCALVVEGRVGPDVAVADSAENIKPRKYLMAKSKDFFRKLANLVLAKDAAPDAKVEEEEVERAAEIIEKAQGILDLHENTPEGVIDKPEGGAEEPDKKREAPAVSDEVKKALDACGLDAENPDFQKAFAEGVKYGERLEKKEPDKLDSEHESEGMKKAMDEEEIVKSASDAAMNRFQSILDAQREVRPVVGEVAVNLASDSAETVYGAALDAMGVDKKAHPRSAWRSVFQVLARSRAEVAPHTASDAALAESPLKNIKVL